MLTRRFIQRRFATGYTPANRQSSPLYFMSWNTLSASCCTFLTCTSPVGVLVLMASISSSMNTISVPGNINSRKNRRWLVSPRVVSRIIQWTGLPATAVAYTAASPQGTTNHRESLKPPRARVARVLVTKVPGLPALQQHQTVPDILFYTNRLIITSIP